MFFVKTKPILKNIDSNNIKVLEIYKKSGKTFQLYCDVKKSSGTIANNTNYCLSLLTSNGFVMLIDNRQLDIPEVKMEDGEEQTLNKIEEGFAVFKQYADIL